MTPAIQHPRKGIEIPTAVRETCSFYDEALGQRMKECWKTWRKAAASVFSAVCPREGFLSPGQTLARAR